MKWIDLFKNWELKNVSLNLKFAQLDFQPNAYDSEAAWRMYIELITRITTQTLLPTEGDEKTALDSIYCIFGLTRDILKEYGKKCKEFNRISIIVLNQIIRPFTAKWHKLSLNNVFEDENECLKFRKELKELQNKLKLYTKLLAEIAQVEDLTSLNDV